MSDDPSSSSSKPVKMERVMNVMGSCAGAGSGDFHTYRHTRRAEMTRLETLSREAKEAELDEEFERRAELKRKVCEERTAKKAEKRRRKKQKRAVPKPPLPNDGSFLEVAKKMKLAANND